MEHELRILSGLHRGACLPLVLGGKLTVGADPACDVVLVDPGMQPLEFSVQLEPGGWRVERFDRKGRAGEAACFPWDQPLAFGGVAVTVCESGRDWEFVAADEVAAVAARGDAAQAQSAAAAPAWAQPGGEGAAAPARAAGGLFKRFAGGRKVTRRLIVMGSVMLGFATFSLSRTVPSTEESRLPGASIPWGDHRAAAAAGAASGAASGRPREAFPRGRAALPDVDPFDAVVARVMAEDQAQQGQQPTAPRQPGAAAADKPPPSPAQLRAMMIQRLKDAYLADKLELDLTDTAWNMRGALDEDDSRLFGRILASFYKEHGVNIPLHAYVNSAEEMLPFKIQQYSGGALGSVVTSDGHRLYVGDSHKGYTLQRIDGRRILFAGKRKVEVVW